MHRDPFEEAAAGRAGGIGSCSTAGRTGKSGMANIGPTAATARAGRRGCVFGKRCRCSSRPSRVWVGGTPLAGARLSISPECGRRPSHPLITHVSVPPLSPADLVDLPGGLLELPDLSVLSWVRLN